MDGRRKVLKLSSHAALTCGVSGGKAVLEGMTLSGVSIFKAPPAFRYRYFSSWSANPPWRELVWSAPKTAKDGVSAVGDIRMDDNKEHAFAVEMKLRPREYSACGRKFSGLGISFHAQGKVSAAMELEMSVPLGGPFRYCHIQDLYTPKKCADMRAADWSGMRGGEWQSRRSPFDLFTCDNSALFVRLDSLDQMFFSEAAPVKGEGPSLNYKFTFEGERKWESSELAFLLHKESLPLLKQKDLWCDLFLSESERFRKAAGVVREEVVPMANLPIDGGTPGCAPKSALKIQGKFDEFADKALALCERMNFKRVMIGAPWISYRTLGMKVKAQSDIFYDSRCGILDFEIAPEYGGRKAFRAFCDKAHEKGVEVFAWHPGFHLANHSHFLSEHPEWIIRKADGSPFTWVYFHITAISPRLEAQRLFLENLKSIKADCGLDGLWLDSYCFSFMTLDFSREQGLSMAHEGIQMVKRLQDIGLKVVNEGYAPFGVRGDGEGMFYLKQEDMAVDTSIFTYYKNLPAMLEDGAYFRFLANKAPMTVAPKYIPAGKRKLVAAWNKAFNEAVPHMGRRTLLEDGRGVSWTTDGGSVILFSYKDFELKLPGASRVTDLMDGGVCGSLSLKAYRVYKIERQ